MSQKRSAKNIISFIACTGICLALGGILLTATMDRFEIFCADDQIPCVPLTPKIQSIFGEHLPPAFITTDNFSSYQWGALGVIACIEIIAIVLLVNTPRKKK
jgi:hypothetical protein